MRPGDRVDEIRALVDVTRDLGGRVLLADQIPWLESARFEDVAFGYLIGILDPRGAVKLETERFRRGFHQGERQKRIAILGESDADVAEALLGSVAPSDLLGDGVSRRRWLWVELDLLYERWSRGIGDPLAEATELFSAWGEGGATIGAIVRPRGLDAISFGEAARARFVRRIAEYLRREQSLV